MEGSFVRFVFEQAGPAGDGLAQRARAGARAFRGYQVSAGVSQEAFGQGEIIRRNRGRVEVVPQSVRWLRGFVWAWRQKTPLALILKR